MLAKFMMVAVGGALGATARYAIHLLWLRHSTFPLGTLTANLLGCVVIGVLMAISLRRDWLDEGTRLLVVTGLLGSLTTFSTFGYETFDLAQQGKWPVAAANVAANLVLGLAGVAIGWGVTVRVL